MNSRLLGEYVDEVETASEAVKSDNDRVSTSCSMSTVVGIQEHAIIDPIVQELDRIIQCTNEQEERSTLQISSLKNTR